jgi:zinc protease
VTEQKADSVYGSMPNRVDPALFTISARVKKQADTDYVRDQILATVKQFQEKAVDAAKLDAVKKHLRYELALSLDSSDAIAAILASYVALRRTPETLNKYFEEFAALTPEDVQAAASKYLVENGRTLVTLTPGGAR